MPRGERPRSLLHRRVDAGRHGLEHEALTLPGRALSKAWDLIGSEQIQGAPRSPAICATPLRRPQRARRLSPARERRIAVPNCRTRARSRRFVTGRPGPSRSKGEFIVEFHVPKPSRIIGCLSSLHPRLNGHQAPSWASGATSRRWTHGVCTDALFVLGAVAPHTHVTYRRRGVSCTVGHNLDKKPYPAR